MKQILWHASKQIPDTRVALHWWRNSQKMERPLRGFVWIIHGLGEHAGRYEDLARFLNQLDFDVLGIDLPGHGLTRKEGGQKEIRDFRFMLQELSNSFEFWNRQGPLSAKQPELSPWYLFGHSMGALLGLTWTLKAKEWTQFPYDFAQRAFFSAPPLSLRLPVPAWKKSLANTMTHVMPFLEMGNEITPEMLSYDAANVAAFREDSLNHGKSTPKNFLSLLECADLVLREPQNFEIPLCLAVGADDPITDPAGLERFFHSLGTHKKFIKIPNARHEIVNEIQKRDVYEAVASWFL